MVTINELGEFTTYEPYASRAWVDDPRSLEHSEANRARHRQRRQVVRSDGMRYASADDAAGEMAALRGIAHGAAMTSIRRALNPNDGKQTAYGYGWSYE